MNRLVINRAQGGIPASLPGEDHISGFVAYVSALPTADSGVTGFTASNRILPISTIEMAESLGIKPNAEAWELRVLHYNLSECYRINPGIILYVGLFASHHPHTPSQRLRPCRTLHRVASDRSESMSVISLPMPRWSRQRRASLIR